MVTYDPSLGFVLNGQRANLYGRVGRNVLDANTAAQGALSGNAYDPRYYEAYTYNNGDAGEQTAYRLRPEYAERLGNRTQLASHSVGGYGEVIDPSQVDYDEEFGLLTDRRNIKDPATPRDNLMGNLAMAAFAAPIAYGVALNSGWLGAGGFPPGAGIAGPSLETAGIATGALEGGAGTLGGLGTVTGLEAITLPALEGAPTLASIEGLGAGMANVPWYTQALANAGVNLTNPMMIARGLLGASSLINSLKPSNGGGSDAPGSGDLTPANVPRFNPAGLLVNYKAPTFDPVPFMSGNYSLLGG
jgi:hypothetical protein